MATDELTSISYTCGVNKSTVLVVEWYGTRKKLVLQLLADCTLYMQGDFSKYISSSLQIFDNNCNNGKG